jgi:large subunit ribosomal protein L10e
MAKKPASMYRRITGQANTRREYMRGVPGSRIAQFDMGNLRADFPVVLTLKVQNRVQIRHTALEAGRIAANRLMSSEVGVQNYNLKIRTYPHIVLRENKLATGAGADRVSSGMRRAFGKNVGTAARLERDQAVITIRTSADKGSIKFAKQALWRASMKFPTPCYIDVEQGIEHVN